MNRWLPRFLWMALLWLAVPQYLSAATGETGKWPMEKRQWRRETAKEQLAIAQLAFEGKDYDIAIKAANYIVTHPRWKVMDYAGPAQYLLGRCYEAKGNDEKAFKAYQKLLENFPKVDNYDEIVKRQFIIANRFLAGKFWRIFGYIPLYPSMDKTIQLYEQIIKNGPYSDVAPPAQMNIGLAHENKRGIFVRVPDYEAAAKAYGKAAERYSEQKIGIEALYREGLAHTRQARRAEYDQSVASQAIATFTQFITLYPDEPRVPEAKRIIDSLKTEQARGSYEVARFYEKNHRFRGALIYYNEAVLKDGGSKYANIARQRIDAILKDPRYREELKRAGA